MFVTVARGRAVAICGPAVGSCLAGAPKWSGFMFAAFGCEAVCGWWGSRNQPQLAEPTADEAYSSRVGEHVEALLRRETS